MGGAMDLVGAPGATVVVTMDHTSPDDTPNNIGHLLSSLDRPKSVDHVSTEMPCSTFASRNDLTLCWDMTTLIQPRRHPNRMRQCLTLPRRHPDESRSHPTTTRMKIFLVPRRGTRITRMCVWWE